MHVIDENLLTNGVSNDTHTHNESDSLVLTERMREAERETERAAVSFIFEDWPIDQ